MTNVNGIHPVGPARPVEPIRPAIGVARPAPAEGISDVVEISTIAKLASKIHELPPVRTELVERVKAEIAAGTYETPERLEVAIDRLMEELFP